MLLLAVSCLTLGLLDPAAGQADKVALFDGKSLTGWTRVGGTEKNWLVENGNLVTRGDGGGWLSTEKPYANFHVSLEYRLKPGGNSGLFIRAPHTGDPAYTGMEIQILDDDAAQYADLKPSQYCGSVYGVQATKRGHTRPAGEWNKMEVIARGTRIEVKLNGTSVVDTDLNDHADAAEAHPGIKRPEGYIGLQSHSEPVEFRNVEITRLD